MYSDVIQNATINSFWFLLSCDHGNSFLVIIQYLIIDFEAGFKFFFMWSYLKLQLMIFFFKLIIYVVALSIV